MTIRIDWLEFDLSLDITSGAHKACAHIQKQLFLVACGCLWGKESNTLGLDFWTY